MPLKHLSDLKNTFLLAMPGLADPHFTDAVIYICEHTPEGAMGLIINHPIDVPMSSVFDELTLKYPAHLANRPLLSGGPVQIEQGFILHSPTTTCWQSTMEISPHMNLTFSTDILTAIAQNQGPEQWLMTLGYAGWGEGQLEQEIGDNAWLTSPSDAAIIFSTPFQDRATATAAKMGIDLNKLSTRAGHA